MQVVLVYKNAYGYTKRAERHIVKTVILYHPNSEHGRTMESFAEELTRRNDKPVELLSLETREGAATASLYDIVRYPAVMVVDEKGHLQREWQGSELPLMDEVAGYLVA